MLLPRKFSGIWNELTLCDRINEACQDGILLRLWVRSMLHETIEIYLFVGLPHMSTENDIYMGYFIPAGTLVIGNTWCVADSMHYELFIPHNSPNYQDNAP